MARTKRSTAPEPPEWIELPHALYLKTCAELVTFSHKTINSNIAPGGVRLSREQALELPYVSARTLLGASDTPALDYVANAGKTATSVKQLNQLREGVASAPPDEAQHLLKTLEHATAKGCEIGTDSVSIRARQLLLPRPDGGYVATTPISAGGVSRRIREAVRAHNEQQRAAPSLKRITMGIFGLGGANPQNVGSLVRSMQRPLVFFAPTEKRQIKAALAMHFRGPAIRLPYKLMQAFREWRSTSRAANDGKIPTHMKSRDKEIGHVNAITRAILLQGEKERMQLLAHQDILPMGGAPLVSVKADPIARGLLGPEFRDKNWPRAFSSHLAHLIADYRFGDGREEFCFDQADIYTLQDMIEEVVR